MGKEVSDVFLGSLIDFDMVKGNLFEYCSKINY